MRLVPATIAPAIAAALLAISFVALPGISSRAAPAGQRADSLDRPLLAANMCGDGAPGETQFTIAATGDTFPHEGIQAAGEAHGYDYLFDRVRPFLKIADLAYTNFDGAMLEGSPYTGYPTFNYSPKLATALKNAGIGVVSTANNHILDRGPEGLDATMGVLERAGIVYHGTVATVASQQMRPPYLPLTLARDGVSIKVAFLSFSWGTNGIPDPYNQVNLLWQSNEYGAQGGLRQSVLDTIAQARRESDLVIVAAHWGYEYEFYPDASQIEGAAQMAAAGADLILGTQSHTLQPVDILDTNGRKTLVIYSLANFIAGQGAFQATSFTATSVILYIGAIRQADGTVRVSGYRYLPIMMTDGDTRPAPIPDQGFDDVIDHVRLEMRDFQGARQAGVDPAALGERLDVCPSYTFPDAPGLRVAGDFAQYFATLGSGTAPRPIDEALAVLGAPLGPVVRELTGDCQRTTSVLYTEWQRLELHPELDWPARVLGTQLGTAVYQHRYRVREVQRRANLDGDAIANERFKAFFQAYGGLPVFGYPISGAIGETDERSGRQKTVQYFERARFELNDGASDGAGLLDQVRLGSLSREYTGIAAQCGLAPTATAVGASQPQVQPTAARPPQQAALPAAATRAAAGSGDAWWGWLLVGLGLLMLLGIIAWDLVRQGTVRTPAVRRERYVDRGRAQGAQVQAQVLEDDDLLRRLLGV